MYMILEILVQVFAGFFFLIRPDYVFKELKETYMILEILVQV